MICILLQQASRSHISFQCNGTTGVILEVDLGIATANKSGQNFTSFPDVCDRQVDPGFGGESSAIQVHSLKADLSVSSVLKKSRTFRHARKTSFKFLR